MTAIRSADTHECHRCGFPTRWTVARGDGRERCTGCGDVYPCRSSRCGHLDCEREREAIHDAGRMGQGSERACTT